MTDNGEFDMSEASASSSHGTGDDGTFESFKSNSGASSYACAISSVADAFPGMKVSNTAIDRFVHDLCQALGSAQAVAKLGSQLASISKVYARESDYSFVPPSDRIKIVSTMSYTSLTAGVKPSAVALKLHNVVSIVDREFVTAEDDKVTFSSGGVLAKSNPSGAFPGPKDICEVAKDVLEDFSRLKIATTIGPFTHPYDASLREKLVDYTSKRLKDRNFRGYLSSTENVGSVDPPIKKFSDDMIAIYKKSIVETKSSKTVVASVVRAIEALKQCRIARGEDNTPAIVVPWYYVNMPRGANLVASYKSFIIKYKLKLLSCFNPDNQQIAPVIPNATLEVHDFCGVDAPKDTKRASVLSALLGRGVLTVSTTNANEFTVNAVPCFLTTTLQGETNDTLLPLLSLINARKLFWAPSFTPHNLSIFVSTFDTGYTLANLSDFMSWCVLLNYIRTAVTVNPLNLKLHSVYAKKVWDLVPVQYFTGQFMYDDQTKSLGFEFEHVPISKDQEMSDGSPVFHDKKKAKIEERDPDGGAS